MRQQSNMKKPSFYIKRRFLKNKPAVFGLVVIVIAHIIAILGYAIMPDDTPYANDGAVQIQKKLPGFSTQLLKVKRNVHIEEVNFFEKILFGEENAYSIIPVEDYHIDGFYVKYQPYGRNAIEEKIDLIHATKTIFIGESDKLDTSENYTFRKDTAYYVDRENKLQKISREELVKEFQADNVETRTYLLGTDKAGRDMLSRLLFGTRISLSIGFISVLIALVVGIILGALGGYFGGKLDQFIMWLMTVVWSIPGIMLVIAISMALHSKGIWVAFVAVGLTTWVDVARVVRGQIMSLKEKTFVEAAHALGFSNITIIFRHIMPNVMGPLIVIATSNFAAAILIEAGLSFLGLGVQPPMPSWGVMVNEGYHTMGTPNSWHMVVFPGLCISMLVLAFNLTGNGLRDAYDPQSTAKW